MSRILFFFVLISWICWYGYSEWEMKIYCNFVGETGINLIKV